jgi:general secretion pathway protein G
VNRTFKIIGGVLVGLILLAAVWCFAYPRLFPDRMRTNATKIQMMFLAGAAKNYYFFHNKWPASIQQLIAQPDGNMAEFLKLGTNDPWGHPIVFEPFDPLRGYGRIISYGADGQPGGQGGAEDIVTRYRFRR